MDKRDLEENLTFEPQFNADGLIPCIAQDHKTGQVLMMAYMNADSLYKTIDTKEAYYWSRSRQSLWHKGQSSGAIQKVIEIHTDCDQDTLLLKVEVQGDPKDTCHTGRESCFYRKLSDDGALSFHDG